MGITELNGNRISYIFIYVVTLPFKFESFKEYFWKTEKNIFVASSVSRKKVITEKELKTQNFAVFIVKKKIKRVDKRKEKKNFRISVYKKRMGVVFVDSKE